MSEEDLYYTKQRKEIAPKKLLEFLLDKTKQYYKIGNSDCELAIVDVIIEGYLLDMWSIKDINDERLRFVVEQRLRKLLKG